MKSSVFKARCLKLMDEIAASGEEIVITKHGRPISRLVPYRVPATTLFGLHRGRVAYGDDDLLTADEGWDAAT